MNLRKQLKQMGFSDEQIDTAKIDGQALAEIEAKKPKPVDGMNKTEMQYALELDLSKKAGEIKDWKFESVKLKLAYRTWYTPDFFVEFSDGRIRFVEVKGYLRDDAAVKFKTAREKFPWAEFVMIRKVEGHWVQVNI